MTDSVEVSYDTAFTAYQELEILIEKTGGGDAEEPMTPTALILKRLREEFGDEAIEHIEAVFREVADERGVELSPIDPLTDGTFQAKQELEKTLEER